MLMIQSKINADKSEKNETPPAEQPLQLNISIDEEFNSMVKNGGGNAVLGGETHDFTIESTY